MERVVGGKRMSEREKTCASEKGAVWTEVMGGRGGVKERDGWMEESGRTRSAKRAMQINSGQEEGEGRRGSDPEGKVFWQATPQLARNRSQQ